MPLSPDSERLVEGQPQTTVGQNSITDTEIDESVQYNWTNRHDWARSAPSTGQNFFQQYEDSTNGTTLGWYLSDVPSYRLDLDSNILLEVDPGRTPAVTTFNSLWEAVLGFISTDFIDHGASREIRTEYNGTRDGYVVRDQTNGLDRAVVDRTTGNLTIEGTLDEGATL